MDFKIEFEGPTPTPIPAEPPAVPDKIAKAISGRTRGLKRILIQHEASKGRFAKINGFKLDGSPGKATSVEVDEIGAAVMIAVIAHHDTLRRGDEVAAPQNYRIFFHVIDNNNEIVRPSIEYLFNPSEEAIDIDDDVAQTSAALFETRMERILTRLETQNEQLHARNMALCDAMTTLSTSHVQNMQPMFGMLSFMGQAWMTGAQMQQNALMQMFDAKRDEIEQTHTDRRLEMILGKIGAPIAAIVKAKYGIDLSKVTDEEGDDDDDDADPQPAAKKAEVVRPAWDGQSRDAAGEGAAAQTVSSPEAAAANAQPGEDEEKHPAAMLLYELGRTITPKQWTRLAKLFGEHLELLTKLLEAPTDKAALQRYKKLTTAAGEKVLKLGTLLTPEQSEILGMLQRVMEGVAANWQA